MRYLIICNALQGIVCSWVIVIKTCPTTDRLSKLLIEFITVVQHSFMKLHTHKHTKSYRYTNTQQVSDRFTTSPLWTPLYACPCPTSAELVPCAPVSPSDLCPSSVLQRQPEQTSQHQQHHDRYNKAM